MSIEHQQEVALKILNMLEGGDPYAILAGGAPRDWHFGNTANDLDFYIYLPNATYLFENRRFERLGFTGEFSIKRMDWNEERSEEYKCMEHLKRICEGSYQGVPFQIMIMREPTFKSVIPKMGTSVCMAWWKGGDIKLDPLFELSHVFKTIFKKDDYTAKEKHVRKMIERYPDYKVDSFINLDKYIQGYARKNNIFPSDERVIQHYKGL